MHCGIARFKAADARHRQIRSRRSVGIEDDLVGVGPGLRCHIRRLHVGFMARPHYRLRNFRHLTEFSTARSSQGPPDARHLVMACRATRDGHASRCSSTPTQCKACATAVCVYKCQNSCLSQHRQSLLLSDRHPFPDGDLLGQGPKRIPQVRYAVTSGPAARRSVPHQAPARRVHGTTHRRLRNFRHLTVFGTVRSSQDPPGARLRGMAFRATETAMPVAVAPT
jgi:hypothetical protein